MLQFSWTFLSVYIIQTLNGRQQGYQFECPPVKVQTIHELRMQPLGDHCLSPQPPPPTLHRTKASTTARPYEYNRKVLPDMDMTAGWGSEPCKGTSGFIMESAQAPLINTA